MVLFLWLIPPWQILLLKCETTEYCYDPALYFHFLLCTFISPTSSSWFISPALPLITSPSPFKLSSLPPSDPCLTPGWTMLSLDFSRVYLEPVLSFFFLVIPVCIFRFISVSVSPFGLCIFMMFVILPSSLEDHLLVLFCLPWVDLVCTFGFLECLTHPLLVLLARCVHSPIVLSFVF